MRNLLFCIGVFIGGGWLIACNSSTNTKTTNSDHRDTATLVTDTANTLNARPINDTTVKK